MAQQKSHHELVKEINQCKLEVSKLRNDLNAIDKEKESWFKKREEKSSKIRELIQKIRDSKSKRDELTSEVKGLKAKRDSINKSSPSTPAELSKLKEEKAKLTKSLKIKESPSMIKQQIENLEFKIETEAISFSKEQQLMKKIKEMKKRYNEARIIDEINSKARALTYSIKKTRKESNETHKEVQEKAKQSQASHEEILKISAEVDRLKIDEKLAFTKFSELKNKFTGVNSQLKEKLKAMSSVKEELDRISSDRKEKRKLEQESILKSKEEEVNQKLKRGEKLTTEDLLVFQSTKYK